MNMGNTLKKILVFCNGDVKVYVTKLKVTYYFVHVADCDALLAPQQTVTRSWPRSRWSVCSHMQRHILATSK
jgi:hypothetical protein